MDFIRWLDWGAMRPWWKWVILVLVIVNVLIPLAVTVGLIPRAWLP